MEIDLGKVGQTPRGDYDNLKTYERLDLVVQDGSSYVSLKDNNTQNITDITAWQLSASKGDTGEQGPIGPKGEDFVPIYNTDFNI